MLPENKVPTFQRCDLHVHSSSCESRTYAKEAFEKALLSSELDVVAITDHNMVDVELICTLREKMAACGKTLLAGVELNLHFDEKLITENDLEVSDKSGYFHGIVWCNAEDAQILQTAVFALLDDIDISSSRRERSSPKEISHLSKGKSFSFTAFQERFRNVKHFFTFHENKGDKKRNLSGYLKPNVEKNDNFKRKLFYYNQGLGIEGGGKSKGISNFFEDHLNVTLPYFYCSDAKEIREIGSRFTWIDFDGDLDSLNLAITDPQSRIVTSDKSASRPQQNLTKYLQSVRFDLLRTDNSRVKCELRFAPSFNGIVGSRGSGKSMLTKVLAGQELDSYIDFIDSASIEYRMSGGEYSRNCPKVLYLSQGELGDVFSSASYSKILFIESRLSNMKDAAKQASNKSFEAVKDCLQKEEKLLFAFLGKYEGRLIRPDVLASKRPDGFILGKPPEMRKDGALFNDIKDGIEGHLESIELLIESVNNLRLCAGYPESSSVAAIINRRLMESVAQINDAKSSLMAVKDIVNSLSDEPFKTRNDLIESFLLKLNESNSAKSADIKRYEDLLSDANFFIDDILDLRMSLLQLDKTAEEAVGCMLAPIPGSAYSAGKDKVTIELAFKEAYSYHEAFFRQVKDDQNGNEPLIKYCLHASEPSQAKDYLKGQKFRNLEKPDVCIRKFFENISTDLSKNKDLSVDVLINGKSLGEMSPGMQAQALLKLLLNDGLSKSEYDYIILDQPEDNLDTPTITEVLVQRIKKLKKETQIFVASHSAPVVINGDARLVVMSLSNEKEISYGMGTINGKKAKQMISEVLDGGERFLKMRLYKYDFQVGDQDDKSGSR